MIKLVKTSTNKLKRVKVGSKFSPFTLRYLKWRDEALNFIDLLFFCQKNLVKILEIIWKKFQKP